MNKQQQEILALVKTRLLDDPAAQKWLQNLEESFPKTLKRLLSLENAEAKVAEMAIQAASQYRAMSEAWAPSMGQPSAMSEATRECLLIDWNNV